MKLLKPKASHLRLAKHALLGVIAAPAVLTCMASLSPVQAKTLVYCSEGSPENFAPSINTTGPRLTRPNKFTTTSSNLSAAEQPSYPALRIAGRSQKTAWNTPSSCAKA